MVTTDRPFSHRLDDAGAAELSEVLQKVCVLNKLI